MFTFCCPVCGKPLKEMDKIYQCENGHCYDKAKSGYVNLLRSNRSSVKRHGDDKVMVKARRSFLEHGYYTPLLQQLCHTVNSLASPGCHILDVGCGECWYTSNIYAELKKNKIPVEIGGIDISKEALSSAGKFSELSLAVASAFSLPVSNNSCHILLNIFSPLCVEEFSRVLCPGGFLIRVIPLERHLFSLKEKVYDKPYENNVIDPTLPGLSLINHSELKSSIHLETAEDIQNLFKMTPYYYKTSAQDQEKLSTLSTLDTEIEFGIFIYQKLQ